MRLRGGRQNICTEWGGTEYGGTRRGVMRLTTVVGLGQACLRNAAEYRYFNMTHDNSPTPTIVSFVFGLWGEL